MFRRLQVFFAFEWWPDIVTIIVRGLHTLTADMYTGLVGSILFAAWLGGSGNRIITGWVGENFLVLATVSLAGLLVSGMYSAAFDAPNAAPGIFEYRDLLQLPYGDAYFIAFLLKPAGWIVMVLVALRVDSAIIRPAFDAVDAADVVPSGAANGAEALMGEVTEAATPAKTESGLKRLIWVGFALAVIAIADLALVVYLHYLSHLGVFLPDA
ncbi:MAG: hypothetical protein QF357_04300 [Dehalococcoidia bacterium]|nr:hypothetical protein [Dehalococcoidia bacterium]